MPAFLTTQLMNAISQFFNYLKLKVGNAHPTLLFSPVRLRRETQQIFYTKSLGSASSLLIRTTPLSLRTPAPPASSPSFLPGLSHLRLVDAIRFFGHVIARVVKGARPATLADLFVLTGAALAFQQIGVAQLLKYG